VPHHIIHGTGSTLPAAARVHEPAPDLHGRHETVAADADADDMHAIIACRTFAASTARLSASPDTAEDVITTHASSESGCTWTVSSCIGFVCCDSMCNEGSAGQPACIERIRACCGVGGVLELSCCTSMLVCSCYSIGTLRTSSSSPPQPGGRSWPCASHHCGLCVRACARAWTSRSAALRLRLTPETAPRAGAAPTAPIGCRSPSPSAASTAAGIIIIIIIIGPGPASAAAAAQLRCERPQLRAALDGGGQRRAEAECPEPDVLGVRQQLERGAGGGCREGASGHGGDEGPSESQHQLGRGAGRAQHG
jgi:hypothetical protein